MNVRLVAYRNATTSSTSETTYQLDLQERPNIALNFKFSDIKEPDTRKSNYSQTFKLPFTENNNKFFENWYNVNATTLVFDTKKKFSAALFVGTIPQFEGFLQLKGVYKLQGYYDVVLMSNAADLFSAIGEKKLRDVFKNDDDTWSAELNHTFNNTAMTNSWNGQNDNFENVAGETLQDATVNVNKLIYPLMFTQPNAFWKENSNQHLAMSNPLDADDYPLGVLDSYQYMVSITQFRPALQIKNIIKLIIARAGFSYTSDFIDGAYFGKIFMTTGNHLEAALIPTLNEDGDMSGTMTVGNLGVWGKYDEDYFPDIGVCEELEPISVPANTIVDDSWGCWNTTYNTFTKMHPTQSAMQIRHFITLNKIEECDCGDLVCQMKYDIWLEGWDNTNNVPLPDVVYAIKEETIYAFGENATTWLDLTNVPIGASLRVRIRPYDLQRQGGGGPAAYIRFGSENSLTSMNLESKIQVLWDNYTPSVYGSEVNVPMCIDPDITQKAFLKDIIQRFNLVVLSDSDDPSNLIIEPYNNYLLDGSLKDWTNKLDVSKERIIKDTTALQKKNVIFTDQEDADIVNKSIKEDLPDLNVYGKVNIEITNNQFATGELKNTPLFAPYINEKVFQNEDTSVESFPDNMAVHYETSYNRTDESIEIVQAKTKPKLFWYTGAATAVKKGSQSLTYYLHNQPVTGEIIETYSFTTYPVCSPYDITPVDNAYTLTPQTKSLYWNANPPMVGQIEVFNYLDTEGTWFDNTLYGLYWKPYLDNIYSSEARIMECHLNLNEVDIFNFKFNDEIFIKDTYWRILEITNYQVGEKSSTKVKMIKVVDSLHNCNDCSLVIGELDGSNLCGEVIYYFCPESNPNCTPINPNVAEDYTNVNVHGNEACCECVGGEPTFLGFDGSTPITLCFADAGSPPLKLKNVASPRAILGGGQLKSYLYGKIGGTNKPLIRGVDTSKYGQSLMPQYGDDIVIKYGIKRKGIPQLKGESHRFVLTGYTEGNTTAYAYPEGSLNNPKLRIPNNTNTVIRVKGTTTVIGGTSATYTMGSTEAFAYYTGFKSTIQGATQMGTVGGQQEFSLREGVNPTTCTLYIDVSGSVLNFGLKDNQTDTKRIWTLTVDMDVNKIYNMSIPFKADWAIYQNADNIELQTGDFLLWN